MIFEQRNWWRSGAKLGCIDNNEEMKDTKPYKQFMWDVKKQ